MLFVALAAACLLAPENANAAERPRRGRSPFGPDFGKGGTVRVELITNYWPQRGGINGRCGGGGGTRPKDPCQFLFDDALAGTVECAVAATQQKGGTDRLYGCRTNAVPQIQTALGKSVTICFNDVYGATENYPGVGVNGKPNPVKFDLATKPESQPGKKVNQAGAGDVSCEGRTENAQNRTRTPERDPNATQPPPPPPAQAAQNPPPAEEPPASPPPSSPPSPPAQTAASSPGGGMPSLPSFPSFPESGGGNPPALPLALAPPAAPKPVAQKPPISVVKLGESFGTEKDKVPVVPGKKDSDISRREPPPVMAATGASAEAFPLAHAAPAGSAASRLPASATAAGGGGAALSAGDPPPLPPRSTGSSSKGSAPAAPSGSESYGSAGGMPSGSLAVPPGALPPLARAGMPAEEESTPAGEPAAEQASAAAPDWESQGGIGGVDSPSLFDRVHSVHARYQDKEYLR